MSAARRFPDAGFTLIETLVSLSIIGTVMLFTTFAFVRAQASTRLQGERQAAAQFATDTLDELQATPYAVLVRRTVAATDGVAAGALGPVLDTAAALASGTLEKTTGGRSFRLSWYAVTCTTPACTLTVGTALTVPMLQLAVAVSWVAKECAADPGGRCVFSTSTLMNPTAPGAGAITLPTAGPPPPVATPAPVLPDAIWAMNRFTVSDAVVTVTGTVHSNRDIVFTGSTGTIAPRIEYGGTYTKDMSSLTLTTPAPVKVPPDTPVIRDIADFRPGGARAVAAGSGYRQIPCAAGATWNYSAAAVGAATVLYVPCNVAISAMAGVKALLVAEGRITVTGASSTIGDATRASTTGLLSNSTAPGAITLSGSEITVYGSVQAINGGVVVTGSIAELRCGVIGDTITMDSNLVTVAVDTGCVP